MKLKITKIKLGELEAYVNSEAFGQLETIPISPERALSYLANPNGKPDDIVLYLGYSGDKLIAFRTLFADVIHTYCKQIRFGWCSGTWVHPDYRKKGYSEKLLREAYEDWNRQLMITNYAPNAEKTCINSGLFLSVHQFNGIRAYLFPKTRKLISFPQKNKLFKFISSVCDLLIQTYTGIRIKLFKNKVIRGIEFIELFLPDKQCLSLLSEVDKPFMCDRQRLDWVFKFPWLTSKKNKNTDKYPFSSHSPSFDYKTIKIFSSRKLIGFFIFSVREGHLKTLYWNLPAGVEKQTAQFIRNYCVKHKIEFATVYKTAVAAELIKRKFPFLHVKKYGQKIYSTFELEDVGQFEFQDSTGDVIFT